MNQKIYQRRRESWAEAARKLPHNHGPETRKLNSRDETTGYSLLGSGLQNYMDREPGWTNWSEPENGADGTRSQAVDDTTTIIAEYYALSTELVDHLYELDCEEHPVEDLCRMLVQAGYTSTDPRVAGK